MMGNVGVASQLSLRPEEAGQLRRAVAAVARGQARHPAQTSVEVGVSGGAPSERFLCLVKIDGEGGGEVRLLDEMNGRGPEQRELRAGSDEAARIFGRLESLLPEFEPNRAPGFVPDSLVGFVIVRAGELENRTCFAVSSAPFETRAARGLVPIAAMDDSLRVDPEQVPSGVIQLFEEMTRLARELIH
jgi:hypothetical protein